MKTSSAEKRRDCPPASGPGAKIRASKSAPRRAAALFLVHALIAVHIAHWLSTGSSLSPLEPSEAMEFVKHDLVNAGLIFFGLAILSTLVLGRWFCGWACHLVALQDSCSWLLRKVGIRPKPLRSRLLAFVPAAAAVYMFLYPLLHRWWFGRGFTTPKIALTKQDFWETFPPWTVALVTFAVCGFVTIYFLGAKGFCTYACPYGAIFGLVDRLAVGRIRVTDACEGCGHCTATCSSNVIVHEEVRQHGMVVDPGCMKCLDCVSVCPKNALYFGFGRPSFWTRAASKLRSRASFSLGEELLAAAAFLAAFFAFRGLYGVIPFLLALALAGILACCSVALARATQRRELSFCGRALKRGGRWTRAGAVFAALMLAIAVLAVHSALVQYHSARSARAFDDAHELQEAFLVDPRRALEGERRIQVENALQSARFVQRWGLLPSPQNDLQLAWFCLLVGSPGEFERRLASAVANDPELVSARFDLGLFLEARGRAEEACAQYEAGLAQVPSAGGYDRLAQLQWRIGKREDALATYERAAHAHPENTDVHFNLGVAQAELGRFARAADAFRRVLELDPERVDAAENLAGVLAAQESEVGAPR